MDKHSNSRAKISKSIFTTLLLVSGGFCGVIVGDKVEAYKAEKSKLTQSQNTNEEDLSGSPDK